MLITKPADGGGIRGVSELLMLDEIMSRIKHDLGLSEPPRPCEYFHLIGGTSTGGQVSLRDNAAVIDCYKINCADVGSAENDCKRSAGRI